MIPPAVAAVLKPALLVGALGGRNKSSFSLFKATEKQVYRPNAEAICVRLYALQLWSFDPRCLSREMSLLVHPDLERHLG